MTYPNSRLRQLIAFNAARLLVEDSQLDFSSAVAKAAAQFGRVRRENLPSQEETATALLEYRNLYSRSINSLAIASAQRREALHVMRFFHDFHPRLVGRAIEDPDVGAKVISIQLYSETAEAPLLLLREAQLPFRQKSKRIVWDKWHSADCPSLEVDLEGHCIEITVLPADWRHHLKRRRTPTHFSATLKELERMVDSNDGANPIDCGSHR